MPRFFQDPVVLQFTYITQEYSPHEMGFYAEIVCGFWELIEQ